MKKLSPVIVKLANKILPKMFNETIHGSVVRTAQGLKFQRASLASGFDTVRLGLPKVKRCYSCNHINLKAMCQNIGATLHQVKYTNEHDSVAFDRTDKILKHYYKTYGNKQEMFDRFVRTNGVWHIEYKDVQHWIIDYQRSNYISIELYGLSQLDHDKGSIRFELLNHIVGFYGQNSRDENKVAMIGYDFSIDLPIDFDKAMQNLIIPYLWNENKKRKKIRD
jgi:hypothetical protein